MPERTGLVGREAERARVVETVDAARLGHGSLLLIAGEAGIGKTRLTDEAATESDVLALRGRATHGITSPYGPLVEALRQHLRAEPEAFAELGPLKDHLAVILPELGVAAAASDRATLFEAVRQALAALSGDRVVVLVLDDLHWSDAATLELLGGLAEPISELAIAVVATYRSDGLPRDHALRRLRNDLRRTGRLEEIVLEPLQADETRELLASHFGRPVADPLVRVVQDRTVGVPFFVEELAHALTAAGVLRDGARGLELASGGEVPLPDTVRDAVLLALAELPEDARAAADAGAVVGEAFDIDVVAEVAGDAAVAELLTHGLVDEDGAGRACFRHALTRESIYADIPWLRRRQLHRAAAEALASRGASAAEVAPHWVGARDTQQARDALLRAAADSQAMYAYRDAADAGRQALELWTDGDDDRRLEALERYATCSELAGDFSEAIRAWRELGDLRGAGVEFAHAQRRLAAAYDLKGERESAFAVRRVAAEAYAEAGLPA